MKRFDEPDPFTLDEIGELVQSMSDRLEHMEAKLDRLDTRLATLNQRLRAHEGLTGTLIEQVIGWESRLSQRLDRLELALRLQETP